MVPRQARTSCPRATDAPAWGWRTGRSKPSTKLSRICSQPSAIWASRHDLHAMLDFLNDMPDKDMALGDWLNRWAAAPGVSGWVGPPIEPYANFSCQAGPPMHWAGDLKTGIAAVPANQYINMDSYLQNLGQSTYKALEAKLEQRFHNGLNILASYTFSKTLTDADVIQPYWSTLQMGAPCRTPRTCGAKRPSAAKTRRKTSSSATSTAARWPRQTLPRHHAQTGQCDHFAPEHQRHPALSERATDQHLRRTGIPGKNSSIRFDRVAGQPVKNQTTKTHCSSTRYRMPQPAQRVISTALLSMIPTCPESRSQRTGATGEGNPWRFGTMPRNSSDIRGPGYDDEDFGISKVIPNPRQNPGGF